MLLLIAQNSFAQSPGIIVRPVSGNGVTILNPDGNAYSSSLTTGFVNSDIAESEIPYYVVPVPITEPTGDVATGPNGGFTDIVKSVDGSGFYLYSDGTNLLFRLRIGNIISGSKGYSVLFDTDGKIGNSGPYADPNYIAATNTSNGNPGFEYEIVFETNFQVAVFNVDGTSNPGSPVSSFALNSNSQISVALSTDGNNPDYFYDWSVPLTAIGSPSSFRIAATTVTSPSSALQGSRSDIYGVDDATNTPTNAWTTAVNAQPTITLTNISSGGTGVAATCTAAPVLNSPINTGTNIAVSGTWTRLDASKPISAIITLYKNGSPAGTVNCTSGGTWNITVASVSPGDIFYAKAQTTGESQCLQSNNVTAGCSSTPVSPSITCASTKGVTGTIPLGSTINIYQVSTANGSPTSVSLTTGLVYTNNASDRTFNYFGSNPQTGNACQGQNGILAANTTYMLVTNNNGCLSAPTFICITGSSQSSWNLITSNSIALTTPIYPFQNTVSGTGASSGQLLRLFVNNQFVTSVTATGSSFNFTGLSLQTGDALKVYAQTSGACMTVSSAFTVGCYTQPPVITTNSAGNLLASATSISGTSSYAGATIALYRGTYPSGTSVGTTTTSSSGAWTISGLSLSSGDNFYALQTASGCTSGASASAAVLGQTNSCPLFSSLTYTESATSVGGTIVLFTGTIRLYLDGVQIGSVAVSNGLTWSIPVNTTWSNTLYPGGILTVTAQSAGNAETKCASTASVSCSSPPQPVITPLLSTILVGQSINFNVFNVASNTWYAVQDNSGTSYATSVYTSNTNNFSFNSRTFTSPGIYTLNISADKLSGCPKSFQTSVITVNNIILPVNFIDITAARYSNGNIVRWIVASEPNIDHYEVERSIDGNVFEFIGSMPFRAGSQTTAEYSFVDKNVPGAAYYYRVKETDRDGQFSYSKIVSVSADAAVQVNIYPNPARDIVNVQVNTGQAEPAKLIVTDAHGQAVSSISVQLKKGGNIFTLNSSLIHAGVYHVSVFSSHQVMTSKLVVLR